jgi:hypothetical protein
LLRTYFTPYSAPARAHVPHTVHHLLTVVAKSISGSLCPVLATPLEVPWHGGWADDHLTTELIEIDENLCRSEALGSIA